MKKAVLLGLAVCLSCEDPIITATCGSDCYEGPENSLNLGICRAGVWACDDDGVITECQGQQFPEIELCDGVDNDCDGEVDNNFQGQGLACDTLCGVSTNSCINGTMVCLPTREPTDEVCDGEDNDCDGEVDEYEDLPIEFCYSADPTTATKGICRPGNLLCFNGQKVCTGEVTPRLEICDGLDNDCNGLADDLPGEDAGIDVVFIIDRSGSMTGVLPRVKTQLITTASQSNPLLNNIRFFLIEIAPFADPTTRWRWNPVCHPDATTVRPCDATTFQSAVQGLTATGGAFEPSYDVFYEVAYNLDWGTGRRLIVWFGDEAGQSYGSPPVSEFDCGMAMFDNAVEWLGFVNPLFITHYDNIGLVFDIYTANLKEEFQKYLVPRCLR